MSEKAKKSFTGLLFGGSMAAALVVFVAFQLSTTTVYVAESNHIRAGEKITETMLQDGTIKAKQVSKSMVNEMTITNFEEIKDKYVKYPIGQGQVIFAYDIAGQNDYKNDPTLIEEKLQAVTLNIDDVLGLPSNIQKGDRINLFTAYKIELGSYGFTEETVKVEELPENLKILFEQNGYNGELSTQNAFNIAQVIAQYVPVVDTIIDSETGKITQVVVGLNTNNAEQTYLSLSGQGKVAASVLPYSDGEYVEEDAKSAITNFQFFLDKHFGDNGLIPTSN